MHVDFKVTTWERVEIHGLTPELEEVVLKRIQEDIITTSNDLVEEVDNLGGSMSYSIVPECEEQMTVEENGGASTIEVFGEDGKGLFQNAPE